MLGVNIPALPASLRRTNQRTVVSLLLRLGQASRASLAKAAGLSQPTAGKITSDLLQSGILREVSTAPATEGNGGSAARRLGRPGRLLALDHRRPRFLAIEIGVSWTGLSVLPIAVRMQDRWETGFPTPSDPGAFIRETGRAARKLGVSGLWGALISVPGIVDEAGGRVLFSPNLHWLEPMNLPGALSAALGIPVLLAQEIRALAMGHLCSEPGGEDFFLVDFGQGVGGAIVLDGQPYPHPTPLSGEFGHTPVAGNRRRCGCGATGCLETLVSESGLLQTFSADERVASPQWPDLVAYVREHGMPDWLEDTLSATAQVISGALNVLGIHRVVMTGLITEFPAPVLEHLFAQVRRGSMWGRFGEVACQIAPRRRAAGLVAAGLDRLVFPHLEDPAIPAAPRTRRRPNPPRGARADK